LKLAFAERAKISMAGANEVTLTTANGRAKGKLTRADAVALGKLRAANVPVVVQNVDDTSYGSGVDGLLGMSFLSRFDLQMSDGFIEIRTRGKK
jgi:aspartyl protease family protein